MLHVCVCSVVSNFLQTHGMQPTRFLCPWNFSGRNTGVGCHFLLQGIFPIQGSNWCLQRLLHWQADSLPLSHLGSAVQDRCPITTSRLIQVSSFWQLSLKNARSVYFMILFFVIGWLDFFIMVCLSFWIFMVLFLFNFFVSHMDSHV